MVCLGRLRALAGEWGGDQGKRKAASKGRLPQWMTWGVPWGRSEETVSTQPSELATGVEELAIFIPPHP